MPTPFESATEAFEKYAAVSSPWDAKAKVPDVSMVALQVELNAWACKNFGAQPNHRNVLGMGEEMGELMEAFLAIMPSMGRLMRAQLKHEQGIRDMKDRDAYKAKMADAIADIMVFAMNACTAMRLDFGTLLSETIQEVVKRDWKKNPNTADVEG